MLQGVYANLSQDPKQYAINGFVPSGDIAPAKRGFGVAETELALSANVDDKIYGNLIFSLVARQHRRGRGGLRRVHRAAGRITPKFGRFLSSIGYLNDQHQHLWDFYDAPLPYQAFLGGQFSSDGLQLKWIAPTDVFSSSAPKSARLSFPGTDRNSNGVGSVAAYVHVGGDSARATAGAPALLPGLRPRSAVPQATTPALDAAGCSGKASWRSPTSSGSRRPTATREHELQAAGRVLLAQGNGRPHLRQRRRARAHLDVELLVAAERLVRRRRLPVHAVLARGARYDRLYTGSVDYGANGAYLARSRTRQALLGDVRLDASEFSRFRLQWQQSQIQRDFTDNQLFVQYILTLGAHGAHKF